MGLDMHFYSVPKGCEPENSDDEICYFRKHADLHGWLEKTRCEMLGECGDFNCVYFDITPEVLMKMKELVKKPVKEHFHGFFWGESTDEDWKKTEALIPKIEEILRSGAKVYYYSWW